MFEEFAKKMKKRREVEVQFKEVPDESTHTVVDNDYEEIPAHKSSAVVANAEDSQSNLELKIVNPDKFQDVITVADYLIKGCTVVINLELLDTETIKRMLDFLNGVCYAIGGEVKFVSKSTYIITPRNIDISEK